MADTGDNHVLLGEILDISRVGDMKAMLQALLDQGHSLIVLEAGDISRIDTSGVQLLLSFINKAKAMSTEISWENTSDAFCRSVELLGLREDLRLPG